ncbi:MAG: peptidylprolyl isomerase [Candidatus Taylorbacteria bacterium CG11_big_fil_rev_8_21_14_0_20_46_11]|uniref:Peptidyl-prolyl cis-trans isomerase n=1 Tax=Candidatus Taylorbacteria bacterium CG11_big_fil_rev_8_21_14_0_20_46_11 TaxID=1975025 RepID=A0A2H0KD66_9BACT|nr:MAG: peptidylprolyl isomerase [Candidatus Taylorbacteria bacterium CG11_big_fil_rev_8_21_14_0_20_46_11]
MTETQVTKATSVILRTSSGDIEIELFPDKAPKTVANFAKLAQDGYYDETKFHRVIKGFMIQGGDPFTKDDTMMDRWGTGGPGYQFEDEINDQKIVRGVLAMANAGPGTNGSQFFIVTAESAPWLDGKHTVFGKVVKGMDIVDRIENVRTGERDIPATPIVIKSIMVK